MRTTFLAVLLSLLAAAPASAAELSLGIAPRDGAILGEEHRFAGELTQDGAPLAGQVVTLEVRPHPYTAAFTTLDTATTGEGGEYRFVADLDRNHEVRVQASGAATVTAAARAYVFPRARLSVRTVRRNVVRITQTFRVARNAGLRARSRFYVARRGAKAARYARSAAARRVGPDRYIAQVDVRIPRAYRGRFSYGACFRVSGGSRLGDPEATCPRRTLRF